MTRSTFNFRFWHVVSGIQQANPKTPGECWGMAVSLGNAQMFGIGANDSIVENKLLYGLLEVSKISDVRTSSDVVEIMGYIEEAWEYYQEKRVLPQPEADLTTGVVRFNEFWRR